MLAIGRADVDDRCELTDDLLADLGLTFLGLEAMYDPPRSEARAAVAACHQASAGGAGPTRAELDMHGAMLAGLHILLRFVAPALVVAAALASVFS